MRAPGLQSSIGAAAIACLLVGNAAAQVVLFAEDFDGLPLQPSVDEFPFPEAFTPLPPPGWDRLDDVPGIGDPAVGVTEWEGWSFAAADFWQATADPSPRQTFASGTGVIAVADPDQWNDLGNPANDDGGGFFNSFLTTPPIDISSSAPPDVRLKLGFDTTWLGGGCCDDGENFQPPEQPEPFSNNQTAVIRLLTQGNEPIDVLRWEAAPFLGPDNEPRNQPGPQTMPNPHFQPFIPDARIWLDLAPAQAAAMLNSMQAGDGSAGSGSGGGMAGLEFAMENAGDDGYWALDNLEVFTITTLPGDMNVNGVLDSGDVPAFALGLLDAIEYRNTYYGELPSTRGTEPDGTFDFDDIEWFVGVLESGGVSTSVEQVAALLQPAPEPTSVALLAVALSVSGGRRWR
ncbi:MAG: PEP-CTERM sorting domain-containing protein [Planctomycetota bacterium]